MSKEKKTKESVIYSAFQSINLWLPSLKDSRQYTFRRIIRKDKSLTTKLASTMQFKSESKGCT